MRAGRDRRSRGCVRVVMRTCRWGAVRSDVTAPFIRPIPLRCHRKMMVRTSQQSSRAAVACLAASLFFTGRSGETAAQEPLNSEALISALHDGYDQWLQQSAFKATYTVRRGEVDEVGARFASGTVPTVVETGELIKMGPSIRRRGTPTEAVMVRVLPDDPTRTQGFAPYDEARAGKVAVKYLAFPGDRGLPAGPYASITMASLLNVEEGVAVGAGRVFSPANFRLVGPGPNPIPRYFLENPPPDGAVVEHEEMIVVTLDEFGRVGTAARGVEKRVVYYDLSGGAFRVRRVEEFMGGEMIQSVEAAEFVDLPAGSVPRVLLRTVGRSLEEWRSDDLGDDEPVSEDLAVVVPAGVPVFGSDGPARADDDRVFNPLEMGEGDLSGVVRRMGETQTLRVQRNLGVGPAGGGGGWAAAFWCVAVTGAIGVGYTVWTRRRGAEL